MADVIHVWHARHGVPNSENSAVEINNRLVDAGESDSRLPLKALIGHVLTHCCIASIRPVVPMYEQSESESESTASLKAPDTADEHHWKESPLEAYAKFRPAALRIELRDSATDFFPCAYSILRFCKACGIVAIRGQIWWPAYWQPDGHFQKHMSVVVDYGKDSWTALEMVLHPGEATPSGATLQAKSEPARSSAIPETLDEPGIRPAWCNLARQLEAALTPHGFNVRTDLGGAHNGSLAASFTRQVAGGHQALKWRMALADSSDPSSDLCCRVAIELHMDAVQSALYAMGLNLGDTRVFQCEITEFVLPAAPDNAGLLHANRDEWGPDTGRMSAESPRNLLKILTILKDHALPYLNQCITPAATLVALARSLYPFYIHPAKKLVLAWHVQDMAQYQELKEAYLNAAGNFINRTDRNVSIKALENISPEFVLAH